MLRETHKRIHYEGDNNQGAGTVQALRPGPGLRHPSSAVPGGGNHFHNDGEDVDDNDLGNLSAEGAPGPARPRRVLR